MDLVLTCFLNPSGLSRAAREYYCALVGAGFRVIPLFLMEPTPEGVDKALADSMIAAAGRPVDTSPLQFYIGSGYAVKALKDRSGLLGSVVFENHALLPRQIEAYRAMDLVLPPSMFCLKACRSAGMPKSKVALLPYALGPEYRPDVEPSIPREEGIFRFLYLNTWYERKGPDALLRAWWSEFSSSDPVELWIKTYVEEGRVASIDRDIRRIAQESGNDISKGAPIRVVDEILDDAALPSFMKSFDCYVSPHRSEGFGMNVWHAMALGVPVVCTDYGGVKDFAKRDTARLVPVVDMVHPGPREAKLFPHLAPILWAEPDVGVLASQMRSAAEDILAGLQRAEKACAFVHARYNRARVFEDFEAAVKGFSRSIWDELNWTRTVEELASQPSPRHQPGEPLRMIEL